MQSKHSYFSSYSSLTLGQSCRDSFECNGNVRSFCNFDNGDTGYCDICRLDIYDSCDEISFPTLRGLQECNRVCRGTFGVIF